VAPAVTGTATVGQTLSTTNGTWTGAPAPTFTYQWFRSPSTSIGGATSSTYVLVVGDVGFGIFCQVTATNVIAPSGVTANSNTTASVAATVPGAPTIGTATATGATTATVAYTAPASDGGATITLYTATSSPGGITGTLSQAGSGTITVSGLTAATSYTFTVKATNSVGQSAASAASNSTTTLPAAIGAAFGGGFFMGQISTSGNGVADYNLVVGPKATAQSTLLQWKTSQTVTAGTDSYVDGSANTAAMIAAGAAAHPCGQFCDNVSTGGQTDWYMPADYELEIAYFNLKPSTLANSTSGGNNPYAVPARSSNYTAGTPAQTSATSFQAGNSEAFDTEAYWSSTTWTAYKPYRYARYRFLSDGTDYPLPKTLSRRVRAIRRVAV
jgi:hypothetical protein